MSDENTAVDDMKSSAELEPLIAGVESIAKTVTKHKTDVDDKVEKIEKATTRAVEDIEGKMNKGFEDVLERLERSNKAHSATVRAALGNIEPSRDSLNEVIDKSYKERSGLFEMIASRLPSELALAKPDVHMAAAQWLENSTKAQLRKYSGRGEYAQKADKLYSAMQDVAHVKANPLQEDTDNEGGYLVPTLVEGDVQRLMTDAGKIFPLCRQLTMTSKVTNVPNEATAATVAWLAEEGTLAGTEPVFGQVAIEAEKLYGRATLSLELLQDSTTNLLPWLLRVFSELMAGELDSKVMLGDGTTSCEMLGIINGVGLNVETDTTQTALTWDHVVRAFTGASEAAARDDGYWFVSPAGFKNLIALTDTNGQPIVHFGTATQAAPAPTVLGRPLVTSARWGGNLTLDQVTLTKTKLVFGPPSAYTFGTRIGMTWDVTDQVNWAKYQADCRLVGRYGGRPAVAAAFTTMETGY